VSDQSYNLLDNPWIPVTWLDRTAGKPDSVGIRRALADAQEIRSLSHTSPFVEFGLHRLLITIVLDAYLLAGKRPTVGKARAMLEVGRFDAGVLGKYLGDYKEAFDLWWEDQPFLQVAAVKGRSEAVSKMIAHVPSGTKITFWHHYAEHETRLSDEEAARELCAVAPFCFDYAPRDVCTVGGDPPLYVLMLGNSLFESIVFNLPRPSGRLTVRREEQCGPTWRCPVQDATEIPRAPTLAQGWTWPVRQIRLTRGFQEVAEAVNTAGAGKTAAKERVKAWRDPNAATVTGATGLRHIRPTDLIPRFARGSRQGDQDPLLFWRDFVPMCLVASEGEVLRGERVRSRPEVVTNALRIAEGRLLRLAVYGFVDKGGQNNKVFRTWFRSVLSLPAEVARDSRLSARAIEAFEKAQKVADALRDALRMLRPPPPMKASKRRKPPPTRGEADALSDFWQRLEAVLARSYLDDLSSNKPTADEGLRTTLRREARAAFTKASAPHRRTADGLFRIANATNWVERRLAQLLPKSQSQENS
jgi:CRISPR type I-E-associated protein CasA/Cse1